MSDKTLMTAFDFTAEDLTANRDGRITERQRARAGGHHYGSALSPGKDGRSNLWARVLPVLLLLALVILFMIFLSVSIGEDFDNQQRVLLLAGVALVLGLLGWLLTGKPQSAAPAPRAKSQKTPYEVWNVTGKAVTSIDGTLTIKGISFPVRPGQLSRIFENEIYTVYFLPGALPVLLSLEQHTEGAAPRTNAESVLDTHDLPRSTLRLTADGELLPGGLESDENRDPFVGKHR